MGLVAVRYGTEEPPKFLTTGNEPVVPEPANVVYAVLDGARFVDAQDGSACGVMPDDTLRCLGPIANEWDDEDRVSRSHRDFGKHPDIVELSVGKLHACALRKNGEVMCWGHVGPGLLGNGDSDIRERGAMRGLNDAKVVQLAPEGNGGCAIRNDGRVACWGTNARGQFGTKETPGSATPVDVPGVEKAVRFVANEHCVVRSDARVQCWSSDNETSPKHDPKAWLLSTMDAVDAASTDRGLCIVQKSARSSAMDRRRSRRSRDRPARSRSRTEAVTHRMSRACSSLGSPVVAGR